MIFKLITCKVYVASSLTNVFQVALCFDSMTCIIQPEVQFFRYRGSPDSTNFVPPGNHTIAKIVLFGTDLELKLRFMTFGFPKSPFSHISGLHLMKNYGFFLLFIPHLNN